MNNTKNSHRTRSYPWNIDHYINELFNSNLNDLVQNTDFIQRTPPVNVVETEKAFKLEFAVPGLAKKDIAIKLEEGILTVSADISKPTVDGEKYKMKQWAFNKFKRTYKVPRGVDFAAIKANMSHGILSILLPKSPDQAAKDINIS